MATPKLHVPTAVGTEALAELDQVPWATLAHAYGTGIEEDGLDFDVECCLVNLGEEEEELRTEAADSLFSNICHQGTIYQATAYAFPFLAALAASEHLPEEDESFYEAMLASIGIAASFVAPEESHAGSVSAEVAVLTREAIRASEGHLREMARQHPTLAKVQAGLAALVKGETPDPSAVEHLRVLLA